MERRMVKDSLYILMNGYHVGSWQNLSNGTTTFQYTDKWLETDGSRPISLSMPLRKQIYEGDVVYNYFDNLLPDSREIRAKIQRRFSVTSSQPFDLLSAIGADCVGAIQICEDDYQDVKNIQAKSLSNSEVTELLKNYSDSSVSTTEKNDYFRISIAGAQEKTALLWYKNKWCIPRGVTPTSHIFKFPIGKIDNLDMTSSCENEWLCLQIAKAFGLSVAHATVEEFGEVKVLVVERFDRRWSDDRTWLIRLPQEDMCQALGISPNLKYQSHGGAGIKEIMGLLLSSENANSDRENFFRTLILFWLLAATDGHGKNFSIFINPGGKYRLTPIYDVISVYPLIENKSLPKQKVAMAMALRGNQNYYKWDSILPRHFLSTAQIVNFPARKTEEILVEMLERVNEVIEKVSINLPRDFPENIYQPIFAGMENLARRSLKNPLK
jgi:serine/threonine-protein kinase HipA